MFLVRLSSVQSPVYEVVRYLMLGFRYPMSGVSKYDLQLRHPRLPFRSEESFDCSNSDQAHIYVEFHMSASSLNQAAPGRMTNFVRP